MNIKTYLNIDANNQDEQGRVMSHEAIYTKIVTDIGLAKLLPHIPATRDEIISALQTDEYLNNIPIRKWDSRKLHVFKLMRNIGITSISLAQAVCVLKQAARMSVANQMATQHVAQEACATTDTVNP